MEVKKKNSSKVKWANDSPKTKWENDSEQINYGNNTLKD